MTRRIFLVTAVLALTLVDRLPARAQAPDLKSIAGRWTGNGRSALGINPLEWTIKEDGTVDVLASLPNGAVTGKARMSVKGGGFFYESGSSSGPVTIEGEGGRRVLKYDATFKRDNSKGGAELKPSK